MSTINTNPNETTRHVRIPSNFHHSDTTSDAVGSRTPYHQLNPLPQSAPLPNDRGWRHASRKTTPASRKTDPAPNHSPPNDLSMQRMKTRRAAITAHRTRHNCHTWPRSPLPCRSSFSGVADVVGALQRSSMLLPPLPLPHFDAPYARRPLRASDGSRRTISEASCGPGRRRNDGSNSRSGAN